MNVLNVGKLIAFVVAYENNMLRITHLPQEITKKATGQTLDSDNSQGEKRENQRVRAEGKRLVKFENVFVEIFFLI